MKSTKFFIQRVLLLGLCLLAFTMSMQAQVLDLESTTEGMLAPRMTTAQKDAIPTPDQGLLVYDTETMSFWYYDDMRWNELANNSSSILSEDSTTPGKPIIDLQTTRDTITLLDSGLIDANYLLSVCLVISHTFAADLDISLIAPDGTTINLSSDNGGSGDNYTNTCFVNDDGAPNITSGSAPFTGFYQPEGSFASFIGQQTAGHWVLSVTDDVGGDEGTINSWSISLGFLNPISAGNLSDRDQDTKITVENIIDEDKIRMITAGTEVMQLTSDVVTVSPNGTTVLDIDEDAMTVSPNGTTVLDIDEGAVTVSPKNLRMMEVDSFGTFLGRWNSGHPGIASQLTLSGAFNVGANQGLSDISDPTLGTVKLSIEGYQNDGPVVYPIYVKDENNFEDFFIRNKLSPSGRSQLYFQGNMAIGSQTWASSDSLYRLSVDGKIACEGVLVDLSEDWPDYVFESDYDLKTLAQVRAFIQEKGHLPGVPSAQEMEDHGLDLGEMNTILMEKVEELTLYILQQQDEINNQQDQMDEMKRQFNARLKSLEGKSY